MRRSLYISNYGVGLTHVSPSGLAKQKAKIRWLTPPAEMFRPLGYEMFQPLGYETIQPLGYETIQPLGYEMIQPLGYELFQPLGYEMLRRRAVSCFAVGVIRPIFIFSLTMAIHDGAT